MKKFKSDDALKLDEECVRIFKLIEKHMKDHPTFKLKSTVTHGWSSTEYKYTITLLPK